MPTGAVAMGRPRGFWSPGTCHLLKAGVGRNLRGLFSLPVPCVCEKPGVWDWQWGLMRLLKRVHHQARGEAVRGRMEGAPRCLWGGECPGEARVCPRGDAALELEPRGSGALSTSSGSLDWPGRLLHRPALTAQSPNTRPSGVASWDSPAAVPERRV